MSTVRGAGTAQASGREATPVTDSVRSRPEQRPDGYRADSGARPAGAQTAGRRDRRLRLDPPRQGPRGQPGSLPDLRPPQADGRSTDQPARSPSVSWRDAERLAFLAMVADGVGGGAKGEEASRVALEEVTQYVSGTMRCYYATGAADDQEFIRLAQGGRAPDPAPSSTAAARRTRSTEGMATTLTLYLGVWPSAYLLQVGDSRVLRVPERRAAARSLATRPWHRSSWTLGVLKAARWRHPPGPHPLQLHRGPNDRPGGHPLDMSWGPSSSSAATASPATCPTSGSGTSPRDDVGEAGVRGPPAGRARAGGTDNITIIVGRALRKAD